MLLFYVDIKVGPVIRYVITLNACVIKRYRNDHVGEQEIKTKHNNDKRFHDGRLEIWCYMKIRKRPAGVRLSTRMNLYSSLRSRVIVWQIRFDNMFLVPSPIAKERTDERYLRYQPSQES